MSTLHLLPDWSLPYDGELRRGEPPRIEYDRSRPPTCRAGEIWPALALRRTWGWQMVDERAPREDGLVVHKVRYDAFYGTELDHMLRSWGVKTILLCGTVANICVHHTAASAALRWYEVVIAKDAVSAVEPCDLEFSLRQTSWLFQDRITTSAGVVPRRRRSAQPATKR